MDYSGYSLPPAATGDAQYAYQDDDGLMGAAGGGGWADDGLGTGYDSGAAPAAGGMDDEPLDYFDTFVEEQQPPAAEQEQQPAGSSEQQQQQQPQQPQPGDTPAADDAAAADDDDELAAALDAEMFKGPAAEGSGPAGSKQSQQQGQGADNDMSDAETIDDDAGGLGAADSDTDTASRENSAHPEDPTQAEQMRQQQWYKECYDAMTEAQRNRLEAFNRSNLQRKSMKKVVQELTGLANPNDKLLVALCSVSKMFVGELVATARQIAACQGHTGALLPSHVRAAYQVLQEDGKVPHRVPNKPLRLH